MGDAAPNACLIESPDEFISALARDGWRIAGPRVRDGAVMLDEIDGAANMPCGVSER